MGHLSGPYIAGDIAARAMRGRGEAVLTVSGLDPHQNYVPAKAAKEGRSATELLDDYEALIRHALSAAKVCYDVFIDPRADQGYREGVAGLLDLLVTSKAALVEEVVLARCGGCGATLHHAYVTGACQVCGAASGGGTCEACGAFTTAASLRNARCGRCGGVPVAMLAEVPVLRLEAYRDSLTQTWATAVLPSRVRSLIGYYLQAGLPDVPLAYPTDWGIEFGPGGHRIDVWVEMGLGLLDRVAGALDPAARSPGERIRAWREAGPCWHFLGIDNAFYFSVLFPALFAGAGVAPGWLGGLVVNEFYRLNGRKFSTSRGHAVWAHEFLTEKNAALARLFLSWDRPDREESDFTQPLYEEFREWILPALRGGTGQPGELAAAELARAERCLRLESFDPALAVRCLVRVPARS